MVTTYLLIVEDHPQVLELLALFCKQHLSQEVHILKAENFTEAQAVLENLKIDAVFTDLKLPDGDGTQLASLSPNSMFVYISAHLKGAQFLQENYQGAFNKLDCINQPERLKQTLTAALDGGHIRQYKGGKYGS